MYFCDLEKRESKEIVPGIQMRTFWGEKMLMSVVDLDANASLPDHSHPHEQISYVAAGEIIFFLDGEPTRLTTGDIYTVPPNVPHAVQLLTEHVCLIDAFTPIRQDFL